MSYKSGLSVYYCRRIPLGIPSFIYGLSSALNVNLTDSTDTTSGNTFENVEVH